MSSNNSSNEKQSLHRLKFHSEEAGSVFIEVLFTFVAQLFLSLGVIILFTQVARAEVMSFQEWKKYKISEAQTQSASSENPKPSASNSVKSIKPVKPEASKIALEIAQELTIEDYFALYLSQFRERADFIDAAKKLNSNELGDLLLNLKNTLGRPNAPERPQNLSFSTLNSPEIQIKK